MRQGPIILLVILQSLGAWGLDIFVAPDGDDDAAGTMSHPYMSIGFAIEAAGPGDRVLLLPGVYHQAATMVRRSGAPENPLVIESWSEHPDQFAVIDGGAEPGSGLSQEGLRLQDASWVTIRNVEFRNCWTDVITLERSSYITIQGCRFTETGQHAVSTLDLETHHILIEDCVWSQDPRIWTTWDWEELHHGALSHYNGGFYGGRAGAGDAIIRHNTIRFAFNGLRWWLREEEKGAQRNIEIYDNLFEYCLDNFIEPEVFTANLHVYHNIFGSCPNGVFSIDKVDGGPIYIYGNVGRWSRDGCSKERPWTIYKFSKYGDPGWLAEPLYLYHNSWDYMTAFGASGGEYLKAEDHVYHINNAYSFQGGKDFGLNGWQGQSCRFDSDLSSVAWPKELRDTGFEHGGVVGDPAFLDPQGHDYRLSPGSRGIDGGTILPDFTQWYAGDAPDIGAYDGDQLVYGPPFEHQIGINDTIPEKPRIVRCFARGEQLAVFFSADIAPASLTPATVRVIIHGTSTPVERATFPGPGRAALLDMGRPLGGVEEIELEFEALPVGTDGQAGTLWGADLRLIHIPSEAHLLGEMARVFRSRGASF